LSDYDTALRIASTQALTAAALDYRPPPGHHLAASQQGRDFTSEVQFPSGRRRRRWSVPSLGWPSQLKRSPGPTASSTSPGQPR